MIDERGIPLAELNFLLPTLVAPVSLFRDEFFEKSTLILRKDFSELSLKKK